MRCLEEGLGSAGRVNETEGNQMKIVFTRMMLSLFTAMFCTTRGDSSGGAYMSSLSQCISEGGILTAIMAAEVCGR